MAQHHRKALFVVISLLVVAVLLILLSPYLLHQAQQGASLEQSTAPLSVTSSK